ncbi:MAG: hypothetical protein HYR56_06830 [Acidobacteria bacterium]|nr:hypothetical protein [Acidobacteriota bacterium]MBI3425831.1 hypothetical protein [Acidobacteriota bacterium]
MSNPSRTFLLRNISYQKFFSGVTQWAAPALPLTSVYAIAYQIGLGVLDALHLVCPGVEVARHRKPL